MCYVEAYKLNRIRYFIISFHLAEFSCSPYTLFLGHKTLWGWGSSGQGVQGPGQQGGCYCQVTGLIRHMVVPTVRSVYQCTDGFGQVKTAIVISGMINSKYKPNFSITLSLSTVLI